MIALRFFLVVLVSCSLLFAQSPERSEKNARRVNTTKPNHEGGVTLDVAPVSWGSFLTRTDGSANIGTTYSIGRTQSYYGSVYANYLVGIDDNGLYFPGFTAQSRLLYVFDTSTIAESFEYNLVGVGNTNTGAPESFIVFDAGDFGLEVASPFGDPFAAFTAGPSSFGGFSLSGAGPENWSVDVTSQISDDHSADNDFTGFLVAVQNTPPAAGSLVFWGLWDVGLQQGNQIFTIPTLGTVGLGFFLAVLMIGALWFSRKQRMANGS
ncbi:hypothetical protein SCOR_07025 [Sulfidibacter corallicola]|uniref:IPTL-CTERM protein sorting domain-containing protein n=1 Tax=Sulfidibacter corallicola TaxID=2818388 RepID=A0A8A4TR72_SULCO|nr:hypothetical protein [Sulfidibacter corallicola]QTD51481.1 hypothetical protein J3U87_03345 [Sulfidibacter corallicola]